MSGREFVKPSLKASLCQAANLVDILDSKGCSEKKRALYPKILHYDTLKMYSLITDCVVIF